MVTPPWIQKALISNLSQTYSPNPLLLEGSIGKLALCVKPMGITIYSSLQHFSAFKKIITGLSGRGYLF